MNDLLVLLGLAVIYLACFGWAMFATQRHGPAVEEYFRAARAFVLAGLYLLLVFLTNYWLASTAVKKVFRTEIFDGDPLIKLFFSGSGMRINHLIGLLIVIGSLGISAMFLASAGRLREAAALRSWTQDAHAFRMLLLNFSLWGLALGVFLGMETGLLLFRSAQMMFPAELAKQVTLLPSPGLLFLMHSGTMGTFLLRAFACWYPLNIVLADMFWASSVATLSAAGRRLAAEKATRPTWDSRATVGFGDAHGADNAGPPMPPNGVDGTPWVRTVPPNTGARGRNGGQARRV